MCTPMLPPSNRAGWEAARAQAERRARAEVSRIEAMMARLDPRSQARQLQNASVQLGTARHAVRTTLRLAEWTSQLRAQHPVRYEDLRREIEGR